MTLEHERAIAARTRRLNRMKYRIEQVRVDLSRMRPEWFPGLSLDEVQMYAHQSARELRSYVDKLERYLK